MSKFHRCLGVLSHQDKSHDEKVKITLGSVKAFLDDLVSRLSAQNARTKPWRMIWLGGMLVIRDQNASAWILPAYRKEFVSRGRFPQAEATVDGQSLICVS